jgi:endogenous inhibitor of DNA gyrase (YacG/DUF329 family)
VTDTDGLLDRCGRCGAYARFVTDGRNSNMRSVCCTECANSTGLFLAIDLAMVEWNKEQRAIHAKEGGGK